MIFSGIVIGEISGEDIAEQIGVDCTGVVLDTVCRKADGDYETGFRVVNEIFPSAVRDALDSWLFNPFADSPLVEWGER